MLSQNSLLTLGKDNFISMGDGRSEGSCMYRGRPTGGGRAEGEDVFARRLCAALGGHQVANNA